MVTKGPWTIYQYCMGFKILSLVVMYRGDGTQGGFTIKNYYGGDHYGYKEAMYTNSSD